MGFFQKHWVRKIGYVVMSIYSSLALAIIFMTVPGVVMLPPNYVINLSFDMFIPLIVMFIYFVIGLSGVLAIFTAYKMRGAFKALYVVGSLVVVYSLLFFPLIEWHNPNIDFSPQIIDREILTGKWMDDIHRLELLQDSTFVLIIDSSSFTRSDSLRFKGSWKLENNTIHFSDIYYRWDSPCTVTKSDDSYFITYNLPADLDHWSGNLGLMRETEWLESQ